MRAILGKVFAVLCIVSIVFGAANGRTAELSSAALAGASAAVELTLTLAGTMCLWNGLMSVARDAGALGLFARLTRPLLRRVFPRAGADPEAAGAISAALSANLLGLGNAATPLAVKAMKALAALGAAEASDKGGTGSRSAPRGEGESPTATDEMVTFAVLGCASLDVFPTTVVALRTAAGSADPVGILLPVWCVSACCAVFSVLASKALARFFPAVRSGRGRAKSKADVSGGVSVRRRESA